MTGYMIASITSTYHILLGEEFLRLLGGSLEVGVIYSLGNLDRGNVNLGGGGSHVALVHTTKRNLVDLVRSYTLTLLTNDLPETRRSPEGSCFRNTTRFPAKRPARMIRTVPGVMVARSLVGLGSTAAETSTGKNFDTVLDIRSSRATIRQVHQKTRANTQQRDFDTYNIMKTYLLLWR